jgi:hypothetical protein
VEAVIFLRDVIDEGLDTMEAFGGPPRTQSVRCFLLCIAMQESGPQLEARYQNSPSTTPGPARGWYQFEQGGGVTGVLNHASSRALAIKSCSFLNVLTEPAAVWRALEGHDVLATIFARLLIYTDPAPIPGTEDAAWDYYLRTWRPGKPHRDAWHTNWQFAVDCVTENPL